MKSVTQKGLEELGFCNVGDDDSYIMVMDKNIGANKFTFSYLESYNHLLIVDDRYNRFNSVYIEVNGRMNMIHLSLSLTAKQIKALFILEYGKIDRRKKEFKNYK